VSTTRRALLLAGAAVALPAASARAAERPDVEVLEELLAHEQRLAGAYEAALRRRAIAPGLGETLLAHERDHVRGLEQTLARGGAREPRAGVPSPELTRALGDRRRFARFALELETRAIAAYLAALPALRDAGLRQPLGSIMACGGTHQVALRDALGEPLLPGASGGPTEP
jgi:hypothetical protein